MADWSGVSREHILAAIDKYNTEKPKHPDARFTFLKYQGQNYPAKHIRGMAYAQAYGREISKQEFTGGMETVRFFTRRGFDVYYKGNLIFGDSSKMIKESPTGTALSSEIVNPPAEPVKPASGQNQAHEPKKSRNATDTYRHENRDTSISQDELPAPSTVKGIKMQSKGVIEQKNALQLLLNELFAGDVVCEKTFDWMKTPHLISGPYQAVYNTLHQYRGDTAFAKKNVSLRCDFVIESRKLIIEYDEHQHFSEARGLSLSAYKDIPLAYDRQRWIDACYSIRAKDNQPPNRDETRAYYDSVRDIAAAQNGYTLVRIMHGQTNFEANDSIDTLRSLLSSSIHLSDNESHLEQNKSAHPDVAVLPSLKVGLYLQYDEQRNERDFMKAMKVAKQCDADIIVFPEACYTPFIDRVCEMDILDEKDIDWMLNECLDLSMEIEKPVIVGGQDKFGTLFNIYANDAAADDETATALYVKHTMTQCSAFEFSDYRDDRSLLFPIIYLKSHKIGMTICYDCNHPMFSRVYGLEGVDTIINNTGGDVVYDKWYKYNQVRSIENRCFSFVTMGGNGSVKNPKGYVYGFSPTGKELKPVACLGAPDTPRHNVGGSIYIYDTATDDGTYGEDISYYQESSVNLNGSFPVPVDNPFSVLEKATELEKNLYVLKRMAEAMVFCIVEGGDIFKPEVYLKLMYSKKLLKYKNKKYVILNRFPDATEELMRTQLSVVLKVRSMESYCAVILTTGGYSKCYQCGNNRTSQVVATLDGNFMLDLGRMGGPETIWRDKNGQMKASWRDNVEWLINTLK